MKSYLSSVPVWIYIFLLFISVLFGAWAYWLVQHASVKIAWTTASELNTVGFNLYRRDSAKGQEIRINPELIPGSSDPLTGAEYEYIDQNVEPGKTYYYELEDVEANGATNRSWKTSVTVTRQGLLEGAIALLVGLIAILGILFRIFKEPVADV